MSRVLLVINPELRFRGISAVAVLTSRDGCGVVLRSHVTAEVVFGVSEVVTRVVWWVLHWLCGGQKRSCPVTHYMSSVTPLHESRGECYIGHVVGITLVM